MKKRMRLIGSFALVSLLFFLPTLVFAAKQSESNEITTTEQRVWYLFVVRAEKGSIHHSKNGTVLALQGISPEVLYFSQQPLRKTGFLKLSKFMEYWVTSDSTLQQDPPNVALVYQGLKTNKNGVDNAVAVELSHPVLVNGRDWQFKLKDLEGALGAEEYKDVALFIDSVGHKTFARLVTD